MKGRLDGMSLRVPLPVGSITDFTAVVKGNPSVAEVNAAFAEAAAKPPLDRVLDYTEDPIVSSDIVGSPASCTFDAGLTMVHADQRRALAGQGPSAGTTTSGATPTAWSTSTRPGRRLTAMDPLRGLPLLEDLPDLDGQARPRAGRLQRPAAHRGARPGHGGRRLPHHAPRCRPCAGCRTRAPRWWPARTSGARPARPTRAGRWTRCASGSRRCAPGSG